IFSRMINQCILLLIPFVSSLSKYPIAHTPYGSVRGYEFEASNGFVGEIYKKIPFAAPPIGNKRWKKPGPPEPWNHTIDGTFSGPACAQVDSSWAGYPTGISEDCLTLNVYTSKQCRESNAACAVVVYIHGGSGLFSSSIHFPDDHLVSKYATEGVILVTISYRLGVFGVMALGDEHALPANLAVHDVVESLRFVQQTIHAFGGDKDQVSIMGHSIGSTIVLFLMYSPEVNKAGKPPLFSRAIAISASMNFENVEKQVNRTHGVAAHLGCKGTAHEIITCLLPFSTEQMLRAASEVGGDALGFSATHLAGIVKAGELFPAHEMNEIRENQEDHMTEIAPAPPTKLMIGTQLNEFRQDEFLWWYEANVLNGTVIEAIDVLGVRNYKDCADKYTDDVKSGRFKAEYDTLSQCLILTASLFASEQVRAGGEVYLYQYDYSNHSDHADDLYFLMGVHDYPMDDNEKWLSRVYPVYFTNFIKGLPLAPDWKPLDPKLMNYYSINKSFEEGIVPQMKFGYHQPITDYYLDLQKFDKNLSNVKQLKATAPIMFNSLVLPSSESVNLRDIIFYSVFTVSIVLFIMGVIQCSRNSRRRAGYIVLKSDV
ncbi:hypothetical protein PRIPAC_74746, partial [Pristionchus pacificus]